MNDKILEGISYGLFITGIIVCFMLHFMSVLIPGVTIYLLVTYFYKKIEPKIKEETAKLITLTGLICVFSILLFGFFFVFYSAMKISNGDIQNMEQDLFNILLEIKKYLPSQIVHFIPDDFMVAKEKIALILKNNTTHIFDLTTHSLKVLIHVVIGLVLGSIIAFSSLKKKEKTNKKDKPLIIYFKQRLTIFTSIFSKVMSAQISISGVNTFLTASYLYILLPILGFHMPYANILIILTFFIGLVPVFGNLITNTLIFIISLTIGFKIALLSIAFLIVIHKLEYYMNASIIGNKIGSSIWELLIVMLFMETTFGLVGVILSPVLYGYIKEELKLKSII